MFTLRVVIIWGAISFPSAATAEILVFYDQREWANAAESSGAQIQEIEFFVQETDELTGDKLQPGRHKKISVSGVTFEDVSAPGSAFYLNPYSDPYAGVLFEESNSTLRITFTGNIKGFFLNGVPSGLGAPLIRISNIPHLYKFGLETEHVGFITGEPVQWIEITGRKGFNVNKLFYY